MPPLLFLLSVILAAPLAAEAAPERGGVGRVEWAQLSIHERIIIRVPRLGPPPGPVAPPAPVRWAEKHGDKCVPMAGLAGALVTDKGSVDFVLLGNRRVRARLDGDCHSLDFYSGFYVRPPADGMMCAGRDAVRTRSGAVCPIRAFRRLVPKR
jgi:hypothetical protein